MVTSMKLEKIDLSASSAATESPTPQKRKPGRPRGKNFYLSNADLLAEIIICKERDELTTKAVEMFQLIANGVARKMYYQDPMDRDDCVQSAMLDLLKYWRGFNPLKGTNAFAYYTQVAKAGLAKGWNKLHPPESRRNISLSSEMGNYF